MILRQDLLDISFRLNHIYQFLPLSLGFRVPPQNRVVVVASSLYETGLIRNQSSSMMFM